LFAKVNGKDVIGWPMLHNINRFVLQRIGDFTWREPDCEELVGVTAFGTFIAVFEISFHNHGNEIPV